MSTWLAFITIVFKFNVFHSVPVKYVLFGEYTAAYDPYITLPANEKDCKRICDEDFSCNGYSLDTSNDGCFLSSCNIFIDVPTCSTCKEHRISVVLCPPTSVMPKSTTTTQSTTISLSTTTTDSITKTTNYTPDLDIKDIAVGNTSCVCVCRYVNQTLDESLKRGRKELVLNKTKLLSAIRKLNSASDYRISVEVLGTVAIIVLVLFGLILFCADVSSTGL